LFVTHPLERIESIRKIVQHRFSRKRQVAAACSDNSIQTLVLAGKNGGGGDIKPLNRRVEL